MEQLREYNKKLLYNILPDHVAQHFLAQQAKKNDVSWCNGNLSVTAPKTLFFFFSGMLFILFLLCCSHRNFITSRVIKSSSCSLASVIFLISTLSWMPMVKVWSVCVF